MKVKCDWCGKEFDKKPSVVKEHNFCSRKCMGTWYSENYRGKNHPSWRGGKIRLKCDYCGEEVEQRPYLARTNKHNFCSMKCLGKWRSENLRGENCPTWRGGEVAVKCDNCGKITSKTPKLIERNKHNFCSRECFVKFRCEGQEVKCGYCGRTIYRSPSRLDVRNQFCSQECKATWQIEHLIGEGNPRWSGGDVTVECDYCGKEFTVNRAKKESFDIHFCSRNCYGRWISENKSGENSPIYKQREIKCDYCGKEFKRQPSEIHSVNFCSRDCHSKWWSENMVGENNFRWKGGFERYYGPNWLRQRRKARARDNYTCQVCSEKEDGHELDVHHIVPFRNFGLEDYKEANKLNNLITLCRKCHGKVDSGSLKIEVT